jgi:hypothetical protein
LGGQTPEKTGELRIWQRSCQLKRLGQEKIIARSGSQIENSRCIDPYPVPGDALQTVPNGVWVYLLFDPRSLGGIPARMPNHFCENQLVAAVVLVAWKPPHAWFSL